MDFANRGAPSTRNLERTRASGRRPSRARASHPSTTRRRARAASAADGREAEAFLGAARKACVGLVPGLSTATETYCMEIDVHNTGNPIDGSSVERLSIFDRILAALAQVA